MKYENVTYINFGYRLASVKKISKWRDSTMKSPMIDDNKPVQVEIITLKTHTL